MTNIKSTKRALATSIMAMIICIAMLLGTTYAWFADEVTSSGNKIQAGTLKIDLLVKDDSGEYKSVKDSQAPIFDYDRWEPGYIEAANIKIANLGNLALQYSMQIITDGLVEEFTSGGLMLSDVIDLYYATEEVVLENRAAFNAAVEDGTLKHKGVLTSILFGGSMAKSVLAEGESDYITVVLKMRESAGNEYQNLSVGNHFDVRIYATQYTYEDDSFGDGYDYIELPSATMLILEPDMLDIYQLDAGCIFLANETWDATKPYAYYFADFVANIETTDEVTLWGMYGDYGQQQFDVTLNGGEDTRVIPLADAALPFDMGHISYRQIVEEVKNFACGVKGLEDGNTITITLRLYETSLTKENPNGSFSYEETGAYHDIAVYSYTHEE